MRQKVETRAMLPEHWSAVSQIYKEGIDTGVATFEKEIPTYESWDANHIKTCRIVAVVDEQIVGWAALSPVSSRCVYGGVGEVSVYVGSAFRGHKIGEALLRKLILESEQAGLWTLQSGVLPENIASLKLHEKVGFRKIGFREKIGKLDGVWKDNILLERRSRVVGVT